MVPTKPVDLLSYVQTQLNQRKGNWTVISKSANVPYSTLAHIAQGVTDNPRVKTIQALIEFFHANPTKKAA